MLTVRSALDTFRRARSCSKEQNGYGDRLCLSLLRLGTVQPVCASAFMQRRDRAYSMRAQEPQPGRMPAGAGAFCSHVQENLPAIIRGRGICRGTNDFPTANLNWFQDMSSRDRRLKVQEGEEESVKGLFGRSLWIRVIGVSLQPEAAGVLPEQGKWTQTGKEYSLN